MYRCNNCNKNYQMAGYCSKCGTLLSEINEVNSVNINGIQGNFNNLNNVQINDNKQPISNTIPNGYVNNIQNNNQDNIQENYNQNAVNNDFNSVTQKDDKKYAIISIIMGVVAIFLYIFVGLSVWIALVVCSLGINLANKSKQSSPGLSKAGIIINIILGVIAVIMWILLLITSLI